MSDLEESPTTTTDEELVRTFLTGRGEVFVQLYERYYRRIFRLAWGMVGTPAAEDVTQEIFFRVSQKLSQFAGNSSFSTWVYRLAVNHCLNRREALKPKLETSVSEEPEKLPPTLPTAEARVLQHEIKRQVHRALQSLKPEYRVVVLLKDIEGLSYDEIAARVGCSPGTVASRLNRGRAMLAEKLKHLRGTTP